MRGTNLVWQALQQARRMNLAAAGEAPPVRGRPGQTRREVLKALGVVGAIGTAGGVGALSRPVRAAMPAARHGVAIVGGGIAGLSAMHHLQAAGIPAMLYEARGRMGGRMSTPRSFDGGKPIEDGGQLVNTDHADMKTLLDAYGVRLVDRKADAHRTIILAGGREVGQEALAEALRPIAAQITADADRLEADYAGVAPELDALSIAGYLDRHAALIATPWVRGLLECTSRTEYGVEPDRASAIELIFNLPTVDGARVEVLGASDERFVIAGGSGSLIDAMVAKHASRIRTGRRVTRIGPAAGGAGVVLGLADGKTALADAVVVTVPAPLMRSIGYDVPLDAGWRDLIARMESGRNEKLHVGCSARPWRTGLGVGGELWTTEAAPAAAQGFALGWDGTVADPAAPPGVFTFFLGGDQVEVAASADMAALAKRFVAAAAPAIPGLDKAMTGAVRRTAWHKDPMALGAYSNFPPGFLSRHGQRLWVEAEDPAEAQQAGAGLIAFAGEHMSDAYPGYMNGAAQTGRLAAAYVAQAIASDAQRAA